LPAPILNGGGDRLRIWKNFFVSRSCDLDVDLGPGQGHSVVHLLSSPKTEYCIPSLIKIV